MKITTDSETFINCKDYTVSGEYFSLKRCDYLEMLVTHPQPAPEKLAYYYESNQYVSHTDSRRGIMNMIYQIVKSYMLTQKLKWIRGFQTKGKLLDIGAGTGEFLSKVKKEGWEVHGTEPSSVARKLAFNKGIFLEQEDCRFDDNTFDVITMWHVLEHVSNLQEQIKELERMLRPGGLLVVAVPNYKSHDANVYAEYWAGYDVPRHLWHFSRKSIKEIFTKNGFSLKKEHPLKFDAYYVSLLSEKYKSGNLQPLSAFQTGLKSNQLAKENGEYSSIAYFFEKEK